MAKFAGSITGVSPNGQIVTTFDPVNGPTRVWDLNGRELARLEGHFQAFCHNGQQVLTHDGTNGFRVWSLAGREIAQFKGSFFPPPVVSQNGKYLLTSNLNNTSRLSDCSGKQLAVVPGGYSFRQISSIAVEWSAFSPNGTKVLTYKDGISYMWNLSGKELARFQGQASIFSPDGQRVATSGVGTYPSSLWNLYGKKLAQFQGFAPIFSPDGTKILTLSGSGNASLWNLAGNQLAEFQGTYHSSIFRFSPDGKWVFTYNYDDAVLYLYPVEGLDELLNRSCNWLRDHLINSPDASESDRQMCGITSKK